MQSKLQSIVSFAQGWTLKQARQKSVQLWIIAFVTTLISSQALADAPPPPSDRSGTAQTTITCSGGAVEGDSTSIDRSQLGHINPDGTVLLRGGVHTGDGNGVKLSNSAEALVHGRMYHRMESVHDGPVGFDWLLDEWPYAYERSGASAVYLYLGQDRGVDFTLVSSTYVIKHYQPDLALTHDTGAHTYTLKSNQSGKTSSWTFNDYDGSNGSKKGLCTLHTDSAGNVSTFSIDSSGKTTELQKGIVVDGTTTTYSIEYTYNTGGANVDRLQYATVRFKVGAGSWTNLRRTQYDYYDGTTFLGALNDLRKATLQKYDGSWQDVSCEVYRYHKGLSISSLTRSSNTATATSASHGLANGDTVTICGANQADYNGTYTISNVTTNTFDYTVANSPTTPATGTIAAVKGKGYPHGLKYVVGAEAYRRMMTASLDPTNTSTTDANVATYADRYFEYDSSQRITKLISSGASCGGCPGGGSGGYTSGDTFAYTTSGNGDGYNSWKTKIVKTQPDGNTLTTYTNYADMVMLTILEKTGAGDKWYHFYQYNTRGQVILEAQSSAITGFDDTKADLLNSVSSNYQYLADGAGLIRVTDYYNSTGGGAVDGYVSYRKLKHGETASAVTLSKEEYTSHTNSGDTVYVPSLHVAYPDDSGTTISIQTSYSYVWHSSTNQIQQITTTLPAIGTGQNGPGGGGATRVETFDTFGNRVWLKDERGALSRWKYDVPKAQVTEMIADVNTGSISENTDPYQVPSGWSTAGGMGQHLKSDITVDDLGRVTQVLGPTRVADISGSGTTLRDAAWTAYIENLQLPNAGSTSFDNEKRIAKGYVSGGSNTLVGPVSISKSNKVGRQSESIAANIGTLSLSADFSSVPWLRESSTTINNSGQSTAHSVANTIVVQSPTLDTATMAYDSMGRMTRDVTPAGTITALEHDARGHVTRKQLGTSSLGEESLTTVSEYEYDEGEAGGDGNLTKVTQHVDGGTTRVTNYGYDWRNRRTSVDGEIDLYQTTTYDNLDRVTRIDRKDTTSGGNLIGRTDTAWDDRSRVYLTTSYAVNPSTGTLGNSLTANNWYDASGNLIKAIGAGAGKLHTKRAYDGTGQLTKSYVGYDLSESSYSDAGTVSSDTIVTQSENSYDPAGNLILVATRDRLHDATGSAELSSIGGSQPKARVSFQAMWYDGRGRRSATANYGTNADATLTRPDVAPSRSDTVLVNSTEYDDSWGSAYNDVDQGYKMTDPAGMEMRKYFDNAGRVSKTVEAWQDGSFTTGNSDRDRTTEYTYNDTGKVATITARNAGTGDQITKYVYGVNTSDGSGGTNNKELLRAVIYPDSDDTTGLGNGTDSTYDRVEFKYNRQGEMIERKDQNATVHAYNYDALGRQTHDRITSFGSGVDQAVKRITRAYEVRGMLNRISSYDHATVGSGTFVNDAQMVYNTFSQLTTEYQNTDGEVNTSTSPKVQYSYDDGSGSSNQIRKTKLTYPNGREVYYLYTDAGGSAGISDVLNRVTALATASTRGSSDVNVIASYEFNGLSQLLRKDYPTPDIRLDYWGGSSGTFTGLDTLGRIKSQNWVDYSGSPVDVFEINHGYDRDGNRLYAQNTTQGSASQVYTYDNLNRLTDQQQGLINGTSSIRGYWNTGNQTWTLDATGNQTAVAQDGVSSFYQNTPNKANEYTSRTIKGDVGASYKDYQFGGSTASDWTKPGSGDAFDVNSTNAGHLTITTVAQDTIDSVSEPSAQGIVLIGSDVGPANFGVNLQFPGGTSSGQAGIVFGYKSGADYWIRVFDFTQHEKVYHVVSGTKTLIASTSSTVAAATTLSAGWSSRRNSVEYTNFSNLTDGYPSGRVGLYTTVANTKFDFFQVTSQEQPSDLEGRWSNFTTNGIYSSGRLQLYTGANNYQPIFLRNLRLKKFQATLAVRQEQSSGGAMIRFCFNGKDQDDYDFVRINHLTTKTAPTGDKVINGEIGSAVSGTSTDANMPTLITSSVLWARVTSDGTTLTVRCLAQSGEPSDGDWSGASDCYSSSNFTMTGGLIGIGCWNGIGSVDELKIRSWNTGNSSFDIIEHYDSFGIDGSGNITDPPTHDLAGNMTYDGAGQKYAYDGWNRLKGIAHAYRDGAGTLQNGQTFDTMSYDGKGRRVKKALTNSGQWDCTYKYYSDADSLVETRNGSDSPIKHHVWGTRYIDELVQTTAVTEIPGSHGSPSTYTYVHYWALQDANYNVLGIVDDSGVLIERYQYTPYGRRTALTSVGANDTGCYAPLMAGKRHLTGGSADPWPLCDVGHQGLLHDEEAGVVYNRARHLHAQLGRFGQRDPLGFDSDTNPYVAYHGMPLTMVDPDGALPLCFCTAGWPLPPARGSTGKWDWAITSSGPGSCMGIYFAWWCCPNLYSPCGRTTIWTGNGTGGWIITATSDWGCF